MYILNGVSYQGRRWNSCWRVVGSRRQTARAHVPGKLHQQLAVDRRAVRRRVKWSASEVSGRGMGEQRLLHQEPAAWRHSWHFTSDAASGTCWKSHSLNASSSAVILLNRNNPKWVTMTISALQRFRSDKSEIVIYCLELGKNSWSSIARVRNNKVEPL